jgi:hypothetical protein
MSSSKMINKPVKKKVKVEEVEVVEKKNRRGGVKLVMERVKPPKPVKQKAILKNGSPNARKSPSPVAFEFEHGAESAKPSKTSKVCNRFAKLRHFKPDAKL